MRDCLIFLCGTLVHGMREIIAKNILLHTAASFLPPKQFGRPRTNHKDLIEQFFIVLKSGMPWRYVQNVDFRTAHRHFIRWARLGVFEAAYHRLLRLSRRRRRDGTYLAIDTTFVKNMFGVDVIGRNRTDRGRMATKVVALVDERGLPHRLGFMPANVSDHKVIDSILPIPKTRQGMRVYADKGFDSKRFRNILRRHGMSPRVGKRGTTTPVWSERRRRVVERFFASLDKCRRLILRYDKTVASYAAWTWLASARLATRFVFNDLGGALRGGVVMGGL